MPGVESDPLYALFQSQRNSTLIQAPLTNPFAHSVSETAIESHYVRANYTSPLDSDKVCGGFVEAAALKDIATKEHDEALCELAVNSPPEDGTFMFTFVL